VQLPSNGIRWHACAQPCSSAARVRVQRWLDTRTKFGAKYELSQLRACSELQRCLVGQVPPNRGTWSFAMTSCRQSLHSEGWGGATRLAVAVRVGVEVHVPRVLRLGRGRFALGAAPAGAAVGAPADAALAPPAAVYGKTVASFQK